jgi:hypothetical protein
MVRLPVGDITVTDPDEVVELGDGVEGLIAGAARAAPPPINAATTGTTVAWIKALLARRSALLVYGLAGSGCNLIVCPHN